MGRSAMMRLPNTFGVRQAQQLLQSVDLPGNWLLADRLNNIGETLYNNNIDLV